MKNHWGEAGLVFLVTAAALAVFFYPAVFQNRLIYSGDFTGSDLLELNIPRRALAAQAVAQGEMPLWEPRLGSGLPLLAEGQAGIFYPTTLPLFLTLPLTAAANYSILAALGAAMLGGYFWARTYGFSPGPALVCALAYGLGGAFVFRLKHLNMIQVIAWLPCSLALIRLYWKQWRLPWLLALAAVWSWQFLAGHPHVTYICWLICYLYAAALALEIPAAEADGPRQGRWPRFLGKLLLCTLAVLLLSAVQLLPTLDLVQGSTRASAAAWDKLQRFPFKLTHLLRMAAPFCQGNPAQGTAAKAIFTEGIFWESAPYIGLVPLILAGVGLFRKPRRPALAAACLALLCLWAALGPQGGLYWIFWKLCPGFNLFRFPARLLIPFHCFLALLAAGGAQTLAEWLTQKYNGKVSAAVIAVLLLGTGVDLFLVNRSYQEYLPDKWADKPLSWRLIEEEAQRVYAPTYMVSGGEMLKGGWKGSAEKLLYHAGVLNPDLAALWGVRCHSDHVVFEGGMALEAYFNIQTGEACQWLHAQSAEGTPEWFCPADMFDWFRMQNISHLTSFYPLRDAEANPGIADIKVMGDPAFPEYKLYIYALKDPQPWLRLLPGSEVSADPPRFIRELSDKLPSAAAIDSLYERRIGCSRPTGSLQITELGRNHWQADVNCSESSYLFMAVNYDHNWRAYREDGSLAPIVRFNHAYQAIPLEPGRHRLTVRYESSAFAWGWKISALAWLGLLFLAVYIGKFRKR